MSDTPDLDFLSIKIRMLGNQAAQLLLDQRSPRSDLLLVHPSDVIQDGKSVLNHGTWDAGRFSQAKRRRLQRDGGAVRELPDGWCIRVERISLTPAKR